MKPTRTSVVGRVVQHRYMTPLAGLQVELWSGDICLGDSTTDEDGVFAIEIREREGGPRRNAFQSLQRWRFTPPDLSHC
jgi:hypothetical protein